MDLVKMQIVHISYHDITSRKIHNLYKYMYKFHAIFIF
jgi:hypothetical protein